VNPYPPPGNPYQQQPYQQGYGAPQPGYGAGYGAPQSGYGAPYAQPGATPYGAPGAAPYGAPGYPVAGTNNTTAVIAAILAFLTSATCLWGAFGALLGGALTSSTIYGVDIFPGWFTATMLIVGLANLALGALLITGGVFTLKRKRKGPALVAVGAGGTIVFSIVSLVATIAMANELVGDYGLVSSAGSHVVTAMQLMLPIATLVLALVAPTRRHCAL